MVKNKYYYHLTQKRWPKDITLFPRIDGIHRAIDEPEISRTCVSPTIEGCLVALGNCLNINKKIYIYRTLSKIKTRNPYNIVDSFITKEKWITKPIKFIKIGYINKEIPEFIFDLRAGDKRHLIRQIKYIKILKNMNEKFITYT